MPPIIEKRKASSATTSSSDSDNDATTSKKGKREDNSSLDVRDGKRKFTGSNRFDHDRDKKYERRDNDYHRKPKEKSDSHSWSEDRRSRNDDFERNHKFDRGRRNRRDDWDRDSRNKYQSSSRDRRNLRNGRHDRSRSFDHSTAKWGKDDSRKSKNDKPQNDKQKPNFGLSGKLTEETNTYRGVVIKYSEPPEARKPKRRWRLYPFKGEKALQTLYIHRESAYLIGRDRKVVDLPVDHPSCSKQHAALQYRLVPFTREDGSSGKRIRPYLIDLQSANGTFINNKKIEPQKYVELLERDIIKFGFSSREYVLLHENSKDEAQDDDVKMEDEKVEIKKEENT